MKLLTITLHIYLKIFQKLLDLSQYLREIYFLFMISEILFENESKLTPDIDKGFYSKCIQPLFSSFDTDSGFTQAGEPSYFFNNINESRH